MDTTTTKAAARPRRALFSRFSRDRNGAVAIEFMALALPFSLLVFAILESCISFAGQQILTNATDNVARQLRTGQVKGTDLNETKLKAAICDQLEVIVAAGCPGLEVDLRQYASFADAAKERVKLTGDRDIDKTGFAVDPGLSLSKNMLRVFYRWPVITDYMRKSMAGLKDGKTLHFATVTWQNEPFDD